MRQKPPPAWANTAGARIRAYLGDDAKIGLILGTGWNTALKFEGEKSLEFDTLCPIFKGLPTLEGHDRKVIYGRLAGVPVLALRGRIHLNEAPADPDLPDMVRVQTAMLIEAGCRTLIVTSAVGSLKDEIEVGDVVLPYGLVTVYAPPMPLYAGEFVSPEDTIDHAALQQIYYRCRRKKPARKEALETVGLAPPSRRWNLPLTVHRGNHVMVRGPFFEGRRRDKLLLAQSGADVVGMSLLPELCVAALYPGVKVIPLTFVTNTASEEHSHEENQARAKEKAQALGDLVGHVVRLAGGLADDEELDSQEA
jgi:purine-nucleoside phosphorylase